MKTKIYYLLIFIVLMISSSSCKKDKNSDPSSGINSNSGTAVVAKGTLMFHLHTYIDIQEVDAYNIAYTTDAGRAISLSRTQFYVSDIQLEKLDGTLYDVSNKSILKIFEAESYVIGNVPVGNYKSVRFKIGLPSSTNSQNPTSSADSLILNRSDMWFSSAAQPYGYVFFNVQGSIDTSADMSGKMCPFVYKVGTNANYKQVIMPAQNFSILQNQTQFVHIITDYSRLFSGITLSDNTQLNIKTTSDNSLAIATKIVNNIPLMFRYEN